MTRQESFKRRIRARMAKTGERYVAARRVLLEQSTRPGQRTWISEPSMSDETVHQRTGKGWDEWCDVLDAWPGDVGNHSAIVAYVQESFCIDGWWAQTVAVGYERITGLRLKHQRPDGTFNANKSRTVTVDAVDLRAMLLDEDDRRYLFPGIDTELRSKPTSKVVRLRIGPGTAQIALEELDGGRTRISVAHERLPEAADVETWKGYWSDWLEAVDES